MNLQIFWVPATFAVAKVLKQKKKNKTTFVGFYEVLNQLPKFSSLESVISSSFSSMFYLQICIFVSPMNAFVTM